MACEHFKRCVSMLWMDGDTGEERGDFTVPAEEVLGDEAGED